MYEESSDRVIQNKINSGRCDITWYDGNGEKFFINSSIKIQNLVNFSMSFFNISKSSVTLLPKEFSRSQKWSWMFEFPTDNITPLIEFNWEIAMRLDTFGIDGIHDSLRCWTNSDWFSQFRFPRTDDQNG